MRIHELARRTGVSIRSLRYYEQKRLIDVHRLDNGYRDFDETAIERVRTIQFYFGLGLNTDQIEQIVSCRGKQVVPQKSPLCEEALFLYEKKLQEVEEQITALGVVRSRLQERITHFQRVKTTESFRNTDSFSFPKKREDHAETLMS